MKDIGHNNCEVFNLIKGMLSTVCQIRIKADYWIFR